MTAPVRGRAALDTEVLAIAADRGAAYRDAGLWRQERVSDLVLDRCRAQPDRCAIVDGDRRMTYEELAQAVHEAADRLRARGIAPGDRVCVQLPNCLEYVVLVLALLHVGAPPVLILPAFREHELNHIVAVTRPVALAVDTGTRRFDQLGLARRLRDRHPGLRHLFVRGARQLAEGETDLVRLCRPGPGGTAPEAGRADAAAPGATPQDAAVFLLSGGTTGLPKAIPRAHEGYGYMIRTAVGIAGITSESVNLAVMPAAHGFVMNCPGVLGTLIAGGRVVLATPNSPRAAFELIERERVTHCTLVPTLLLQWLATAPESGADLSSLKVIQVGGARLNADAAARVRTELGATVQQCYGMSEGLLCFTRLDDPDEVIHTTQGSAASAMDEFRVVDANGKPVAQGKVGELLTRGPYTVAGYYRNPEATAAAFTPDGFYRTGDLVRLDRGGNVVLEGRVRDSINRGGEKISAEELESIAQRHPRIVQAAGVAMAHELYGEAVCLYAVLDGEGTVGLSELRRFLEQQGLAAFKFPERLELVDALPLTGIGKIDKKALREDIAGRLTAEAH
ncbi:(2,3-dihydroxybenzoyl)adenylate synthase [Streptantibioticus ferralitis]|uniref:AMP-binding protein n=1 Tax=Streptantibioticus ferralitis TaxID=236510 RepID=A0ABT5ZCH8_9ACTN|nr:AMP-binding protein [Streptantibioticus ferralitis]MDF2261271.1 AMP-binding protein [Streptantibioticus ferralitis]